MTAMDKDALVAMYGDLLANFGAAFEAMQEIMKSQTNLQTSNSARPSANSP
jgi:hypothetical protein